VSGVTLADGTALAAPVVVNVAGPHSARVNDLAGLAGTMAIRTRPMRQEVHHLPSPVGSDGRGLDCLVADDDTGVYFRPELGTMVAVGSLEPACDELEWLDAPDDYRRTVSTAGWERQTLRLARRVPELRIPNQPSGIVGIYDVADDWIPIYDRTDLDGFYVAIGTSGNQFKNAPVAGAAMAELIVRVEDGHDHETAPVHLRGPYTGTDLDLGFFSRNRQINRDSSFSVNG
jgi:glycine/D-amino acid oxidase-like deaminating enzyme